MCGGVCDSSTQAVHAGGINIVAERATTHFKKTEVVRMQAHSANSLDDRLDSSCNGGSVDKASHSVEKNVICAVNGWQRRQPVMSRRRAESRSMMIAGALNV